MMVFSKVVPWNKDEKYYAPKMLPCDGDGSRFIGPVGVDPVSLSDTEFIALCPCSTLLNNGEESPGDVTINPVHMIREKFTYQTGGHLHGDTGAEGFVDVYVGSCLKCNHGYTYYPDFFIFAEVDLTGLVLS